MTRALLILALLCVGCFARADGITNVGSGGVYDVTFGYLAAGVGIPGPPPVCTPGLPTGQMDFSVCSNIAITAALP